MPPKPARAIVEKEAPPAAARRNGVAVTKSIESAKIIPLTRKITGAYYTPDDVAASLVRWVIKTGSDRLLDPACGDGRFIAHHRYSVGIEQDPAAARRAAQRAQFAQIHRTDFFAWAASTDERFDCAAGNPPFIRYQNFKGAVRERALSLCARAGAVFSGLTSSWAPFLVATATLLRPGGRMAFVVPAEIGHAPYAAPLMEYLLARFALIHVIAVRQKVFPELSEDCWFLFVDGFGRSTEQIRFTALDGFAPTAVPPRPELCISVTEWRQAWKRRLRPLLLPASIRGLYREIADQPDTKRFGDLAKIGIGYVTGSNDFFHLRPSRAKQLRLPRKFLRVSVRNGSALPDRSLERTVVKNWLRADEPVLLLHIPKACVQLPKPVRLYLATESAKLARESYKCRNRTPWYAVPDVQVPHFFLTYLSGRSVALVRNAAGCTCTNAVHYVRFREPMSAKFVEEVWGTPFVRLSCEIEGHPLGGGLLKLEPGEANRVLLPSVAAHRTMRRDLAEEGATVLQAWRHYRQIASGD